jgi:hypothetical protein
MLVNLKFLLLSSQVHSHLEKSFKDVISFREQLRQVLCESGNLGH